MTQTTDRRAPLRLTRRGRLVRSALVLLLAGLLVLALVSLVRALADDGTGGAQSRASAVPSDGGSGSDGSGGSGSGATDSAAQSSATSAAAPAPEAEGYAKGGEEPAEIVRSGTVGDGTWTDATSAARTVPPEEGRTVRTYAVRVEGGTGIAADDAAAEIAAVLADPRGWQDLEGVVFHQVPTGEEAEFTISLASPPTVDELCLPARTGGLWSCRIGPDVVLNSDRWLHATPTYGDLGEYRAYMINHEVGHFLGHDHARCGAEHELAPVMLQQSIDLQGCVPNAWPADEPGR